MVKVTPLNKLAVVKKKTTPFNRFHSDRFLRLRSSWRKPRGIDSRIRRQYRGTATMVRAGFGSNKKTKHIMPNGLKKFVVHNIKELDMLLMHNRVYCAEIGHSVSARKRKLLLVRADQLNVTVTNANGGAMQHDDVIWKCVKESFCSFMVKIPEGQTFCSNPYSVTQLCNRTSCPLANSNYATIREEEGVCYLFIKVVERAHSPRNLWEKIKLPKSYAAALALVSEKLEYWPKILVHKIKQRLTRLHQVITRTRKLKLSVQPQRETIQKKSERRERSRETRAERSAHIEKSIESELLARLKKGTYGSLYNFEAEEAKQRETEAEAEREREAERDTEYVEGDFESDLEDVEDWGDWEKEIEYEEEEPAKEAASETTHSR